MDKSKILVVEDEGIVALDIRDRLKKLGYTVTGIAATAYDAILKAEQTSPDLILMDILLQGDVDGIQAAEEIRKTRDIPIVFLSAYSDESTVQRAKMSGPFGYVIKPFEERELHVAIEMAFYRHTMETELRESKQWLATTLKSIGDAVIATDKGGLIRFLNPAAEALTGYTGEDALGKHISDVLNLVTEKDCTAAEDPVNAILKRGAVPPGDHNLFISRNGKKIPIDDSGAPIVDKRGNTLGAVLVFRDISQQQEALCRENRLREKLIQAEKMQSLAMLAGGVAHDLNNLLGPLVGYPDLILAQLDTNNPIHEKLETMKRVAQQASNVIQDLLTLARRGRYEMELVNLNESVKEFLDSPLIAQLQQKHLGIKIETKLKSDIANIKGSQIHLDKVIMNLVVNAMEAMPEGGKLSIETTQEHLEKLYGGFDRIHSGDYVILKVRDSGIGIDPADLDQIFEPYFSRKKMGRSGSGLGLSVVYGIIKDHDAYYDVLSTVGEGTKFVFYFPVAEGAATNEPAGESVVHRGKETVLVVDDDNEQRKLAKEILESLGYKVHTTTNGRNAIKFLKKEHSEILVIDMIMEDDFDGLDTYREAIKLHSDQKAVIISGFSATERVRQMQALGAGAYVKKPYTLEELSKAVRQELDKEKVTAPA